MRGRSDRGYTPGYVRSGAVAFGIGGIRPNKAAKRAKKDSEAKFINKVNSLFKKSLKIEKSRPLR